MKKLTLWLKAHLLFKPKVTMACLIGALSSIAAFSYQIQESFGKKGLVFCVVIAALCGACAAGRSPVPSVDNYIPPTPENGRADP
jgi:hypothetical protein